MTRIRLYVDEDFQRQGLVRAIRARGYDIVTTLEVARTGMPDTDQLDVYKRQLIDHSYVAQDKNPVLQGAPFGGHGHPPMIRQGNLRVEIDRVVGAQVQPIALGHGGDDQVGLHQREAIADAYPWPAAKGHVGELGQRPLALGRPAVGVEALRVGEVCRPAVHDEWR